MPAPAATLNPEPANPEEREEKHLPTKSYADAADPSVNGNGKVEGANKNEDSMSVKRPDFEREESSHEYSAKVCTGNACPSQLHLY